MAKLLSLVEMSARAENKKTSFTTAQNQRLFISELVNEKCRSEHLFLNAQTPGVQTRT